MRIAFNDARTPRIDEQERLMIGSAVRKAVTATAVAAVLVATLGACTTVDPNATASPSVTDSSASPTPEVTTANATPVTPSPSATTGGALGALTGAWKGTWINETPQTAVGTFTLTWAQQGSQLFGAIGVTGSNCLSAGNVTGDVDGNKITFGAVEGNNMITYVGTVSGNTMSGTYSSACGNSKGTWSAIRA
jgi:hypothetical protein